MDRRFDNSTLLSTKTKVGNAYTTQPLPPQGLFIYSITNKAPKSTTDTWHLFTHLMLTLSSLHRIKYLNYFNQQQSPHSYSLSLLIHLFPQRSYQILRSLSPSRMPFARRGELENQLDNWPATHTFKAQELVCGY